MRVDPVGGRVGVFRVLQATEPGEIVTMDRVMAVRGVALAGAVRVGRVAAGWSGEDRAGRRTANRAMNAAVRVWRVWSPPGLPGSAGRRRVPSDVGVRWAEELGLESVVVGAVVDVQEAVRAAADELAVECAAAVWGMRTWWGPKAADGMVALAEHSLRYYDFALRSRARANQQA